MNVSSTSIGAQIDQFLAWSLEETKPRWIVTTERKGTALLRSFLQGAAFKGPRAYWEQVISSDVVCAFPRAKLQEGPILVLDEGVYSGHKIADVHGKLRSRGVHEHMIFVAAFGVHEGCPADVPIHFRWFGQLGDAQYREVRRGVIEHFQRRGSLLLDTEHLEVTVELKCPRPEFFRALSQAGRCLEFVSAGDRVNLTVHHPLIPDEKEFLSRLPEHTSVRDVIRKIRVVEREKALYAVMPIFYPSILSDTDASRLNGLPPVLEELGGDPATNFHLTGVFAAVQLFTSAFMSLRELVAEGKIAVVTPLPGEVGDRISHLTTLFPDIDIDGLHALIQTAVERGRARGLSARRTKKGLSLESAPDRELRRMHWDLLRRILDHTDRCPIESSGVTFAELLQGIRRDPISPERQQARETILSASLDMAIDGADIVTHVDDALFSDGKRRKVRTFGLDGELVEADVRQNAAMWDFLPGETTAELGGQR